MSSLSARLLISVSVLLVFFFGVTIVVLDTAFRSAGEQAQRLKRGAVGRVHVLERARDAVADGLGLALDAAALDASGGSVPAFAAALQQTLVNHGWLPERGRAETPARSPARTSGSWARRWAPR